MENMEDGWRKIAKKLATNVSNIHNGAKLAVASVARATPLFLPRPEIIYINVLHYLAPPRTYLLRATPPLCPDWCHWTFIIQTFYKEKISIKEIHIFMSFYSTLGNCVDLIQGVCLHMKNVLTCKNQHVASLCRDTCDNCGPKSYQCSISSMCLRPKLGTHNH